MSDEALQAFLKDFAGGVSEPMLQSQLRTESIRRMEAKYGGSNQTTMPQASVLTPGNIGKVTPEPKFTGVSTPTEVFRANSSTSGGRYGFVKVRTKRKRAKANKARPGGNSRSDNKQVTAGSGSGKADIQTKSAGKATRRNPTWLKKYQFKKKK
jgi:hypothetical protein